MSVFRPASSGSSGPTTPSKEQYVEAIAQLLTHDKVCSISEIAEQVQVSRPAASRAVQELKDLRLVDHKAYGYVDLTRKGKSLAKSLNARHECLFQFMNTVLGIEREKAEEEACRLEHQVDDDLVLRIRTLTNFISERKNLLGSLQERLQEHLES